jgi:hypothetical protein
MQTADATFAIFAQRRSAKRPWIAFVPQKYLWFELAPKNAPLQALDANLTGLLSVYEYAIATGSVAAAKVFRWRCYCGQAPGSSFPRPRWNPMPRFASMRSSRELTACTSLISSFLHVWPAPLLVLPRGTSLH